jgi:hypothetical protein
LKEKCGKGLDVFIAWAEGGEEELLAKAGCKSPHNVLALAHQPIK